MEKVELTADQKREWEATAALMGWACPGFRHLWYKLMVNTDEHNGDQPSAFFTEDINIPIAATDARNIIVKPSTFFTLPLRQRVFVMAHEIMHNVYDDVGLFHKCKDGILYKDGKTIPWVDELMQKAADYRINALLVESKIGDMPTGQWQGLHDLKVATAEDSVLDVYRKMYDDEEAKGKKPGNQPGNGGGSGKGFDKVLPPGKSTGQKPHQVMQARNPGQWATQLQVAKMLEAKQRQGNLPGALQRMFDELIQPKITWSEFIIGFLARKIGSGGYDYKRPDRRMLLQDIYSPSRSGHGANWVCIWGDTSGSIGNAEMCMYLAELGGIVDEVRPLRLTVLWGDHGIRRVDDYVSASDLNRIRYEGAPGGGGTDCREVFTWIAANGKEPPDALIGLTDCLATFPDVAPDYPVVWGSTVKDAKVPFGEIVCIR